ncbi:TetR family transcriptional regulator [Adlercreutzia sp. R21]|uniref:TetR family transcriptional regulator n=1 Tax=Adlercreutzia wanghongyangiae TaxID=3111451 RepID=UPI002DC05901|nr:TetR family transcriptional regulator [Adlercreutzia sp. R21]MEC4183455.1 TetR family transcriptional regulator [Adlercreutzia sp. R21]
MAEGDQAYRRARTQEQKDQRLDDILDATESILDEGSYHDVTLSAIAERVGCSRANLSHYVKSKEEILLLLYIRSLREILEDMRGIDPTLLDASSADGLKDAAAVLASMLSSHRNFGRLGALLASIIETNVSLECLVECKREIIAVMAEGSGLLVEGGMFDGADDAAGFLFDLSNYVSGLYPATHPLPIQRAACAETGYPIASYEESLRAFLTVQLVGYRALKALGKNGKQRVNSIAGEPCGPLPSEA